VLAVVGLYEITDDWDKSADADIAARCQDHSFVGVTVSQAEQIEFHSPSIG
jgi:hypothetical protein